MSRSNIKKALENIRGVMSHKAQGAQPLGVHLEGPFINPDYKGARNEKDILTPERDLIEDYLDILKIVTIAPEGKGAREHRTRHKNNCLYFNNSNKVVSLLYS
jgi:N-acetylglucosamine-6-phosphate deacetylase